MTIHKLCCCALVLLATAAFAKSSATQSPYAVKAFGAKGDGVAKDTQAVQKAIDACAKNGGGTVVFAPGAYLCGSLHLKSGVTLRLDAGATIKGSKDNADYDPPEKLAFKNDADRETSFFHYALIWGEDIDHAGIVGEGAIDSNRESRVGPKAIALKRCQFVEIRGVRILNIPNYPISLLGTDYVNIDGVTILNAYADGIDPDCCRNVRISNCHIESVDDAIVPKTSFSLGERRSCENITVTNCYLGTASNCFKLGTESGGDFKRVAVSNCVMSGLKSRRPASGGIAVESVDGANIDGVVVSNITMVDVRAPIFVRLGNRGRDMAMAIPGSLKNVSISNVVATNASLTSSITGIPESHVENVTVSDVRIACSGGGLYRALDDAVPEIISEYPDPDMFDGLPGYGLYCRHVNGLVLRNLQVSYSEKFWRVQDQRRKLKWENAVPAPSSPGRPGPALVCDDVADLSIADLHGQAGHDDPVVSFHNVRDVLVTGCLPLKNANPYLYVSGSECANISLLANAPARAGKLVVMDKDVPKDAVHADK